MTHIVRKIYRYKNRLAVDIYNECNINQIELIKRKALWTCYGLSNLSMGNSLPFSFSLWSVFAKRPKLYSKLKKDHWNGLLNFFQLLVHLVQIDTQNICAFKAYNGVWILYLFKYQWITFFKILNIKKMKTLLNIPWHLS